MIKKLLYCFCFVFYGYSFINYVFYNAQLSKGLLAFGLFYVSISFGLDLVRELLRDYINQKYKKVFDEVKMQSDSILKDNTLTKEQKEDKILDIFKAVKTKGE